MIWWKKKKLGNMEFKVKYINDSSNWLYNENDILNLNKNIKEVNEGSEENINKIKEYFEKRWK